MKKKYLALLKMYGPETYAICLGKDGYAMEKLGLVEWVPPVFGSAPHFKITEAGKSVVAAA